MAWVCRWLCGAMVAGMLGSVGWAAEVENFAGAPVFKVHNGEKQGMTLSVVEAPDGGGRTACWTWQAQHAAFHEAYYAADVALPAQGDTLNGTITLRVYAPTAKGLWSVGVRLKDGKNEIFDFAKPLELRDKTWATVEIPVRSGLQKGSWGAAKTGKMEGALLLTGLTLHMAPDAPAGQMYLAQIRYLPAGEVGAAVSQTVRYDLNGAGLLAPFWRSERVLGEAVLFLQEPGEPAATAKLLFAPQSIRRVWDPRSGTVYEAGKDFTQQGRVLVRTQNSRLPFLTRESLYRKPQEKQAIKAKAGDEGVWLYYQESGYCPKQVEIDYDRGEPWDGPRPSCAAGALPATTANLKNRQPLRIVLLGDSISCGANASNKVAPYMPGYPELVRRQLQEATGSTVTLVNLAVAGSTSDGAGKKIPDVLRAEPDLVILCYGANDVAAKNSQRYAANLRTVMEGVRAARPATEFLLVSQGLTNPEWSWAPVAEFAKYRAAALALCGTGVALADVTAVSAAILERKRYYDLTGNGINHPNDYGHRLYAQILLGTLME